MPYLIYLIIITIYIIYLILNTILKKNIRYNFLLLSNIFYTIIVSILIDGSLKMNGYIKSGFLTVVSLALVAGFSGCAQRTSCDIDDTISKQSVKDIEVAKLQSQVTQQNVIIEKNYEMFPPNAKAGECYARVLTPEIYNTVKERVLVKEASTKLIKVPAKYRYVNKKVLVKEASTKIQTIPPVYKTVTEKVLVKEATTKLVTVPAVYKNVRQRVMVECAHTEWKKGKGVYSYSNTLSSKTTPTGEVMCLVKVPAKYKIITKKVMVKPACTIRKTVPAVYRTVTKQVVVTPAREEVVNIPAVYRTVRVKEIVCPETTKEIKIPAVYKTITKKEKVKDSEIKWLPILCETNFTRPRIMMMQRALLRAGFNPGPIDGIIGNKTKSAVRRYQKAHGLSTGAITLETLRSLGIYR